MPITKMASKNRTECDGLRTCAMMQRIKATNVNASAITWTIKIFDNPFRADGGRVKSPGLLLWRRLR